PWLPDGPHLRRHSETQDVRRMLIPGKECDCSNRSAEEGGVLIIDKKSPKDRKTERLASPQNAKEEVVRASRMGRMYFYHILMDLSSFQTNRLFRSDLA
ncbi:hypothetical protein STEG23_018634, partial [Scotinomys teguina]